MNNINKVNDNSQTDFDTEIRRRCRLAVDRFGGVRKFAETIGEDEGKWFNRLTDGRVVGFDVAWLNQILETTGDFEVIIPFFKRNGRIRIKSIIQLCKKLNHAVLPIHKIYTDADTTDILISGLLRTSQKLIQNRRDK